MNTVPKHDLPERTLVVRYDPDQTDECVIAYSAAHGVVAITFGPNKPRSTYRDEALLINVLYAMVDPEGEQ